MFAVIYQGYIKSGLEEVYQRLWKQIATYFVKECGALGSTLHKTEEGMWLAYSKWPNKAARDSAWPKDKRINNARFPTEIHEAIIVLKSCLDDEMPSSEICMEIKDEVFLV